MEEIKDGETEDETYVKAEKTSGTLEKFKTW